MIYLTRRERFSAAHRMFKPEWSDEQNQVVFGKCSNPNWHGHNYVLYITVKGHQAANHGFVININILKKLIKEKIIQKVDHKNLNLDVDFMKGVIPTSENIVTGFWEQLASKINGSNRKLYSMKLSETENNSVEYKG